MPRTRGGGQLGPRRSKRHQGSEDVSETPVQVKKPKRGGKRGSQRRTKVTSNDEVQDVTPEVVDVSSKETGEAELDRIIEDPADEDIVDITPKIRQSPRKRKTENELKAVKTKGRKTQKDVELEVEDGEPVSYEAEGEKGTEDKEDKEDNSGKEGGEAEYMNEDNGPETEHDKEMVDEDAGEEQELSDHFVQTVKEISRHMKERAVEDRNEVPTVLETPVESEDRDEVPTVLETPVVEEGLQTGEKEKKQRKSRGPTKLRRVAKDPQDKVEVTFTDLGEHVGPGLVKLSSFLGAIVREHVPVTVDDWRQVSIAVKDTMWEEIQGRFNANEDWKKDAIFKQMGCLWRAGKSRLVSQLRYTKSTRDRLALKPSNISVPVWNSWIKSRTSQAFKERSSKYRALRRAQIPHTTSRKGMLRLAHDMVWIAGHTRKDGQPVRPEFATTIEKIQSLSEMDSSSGENIREDAVSKVLGKDKSGRVRGFGRGITASKLAFLVTRDSKIADLQSEIAQLKIMVKDLAGKKATVNSDVSGCSKEGVSKEGVRVQIFDWYEEEDILIAEGEFCTEDPSYEIDGIPIGPNAVAVIFKSVIDPAASLWRPTTEVSCIEEAIGVPLAWPLDKVILDSLPDNSQGTPNGKKTPVPEPERCHIYDWSKPTEDVIVGECIVCSDDPKELVNRIPLGRNAVCLKLVKVIVEAAPLWRPTREKKVIGDSLNDILAWPLLKIGTLTSTEPAKTNEKGELSPSTSTSSSKKAKKCILLDCNNSGRIVGEGRVISTDPNVVCHFKPLGPNGTQVCVELVKIKNAAVWRKNSEIEDLSDALGSVIAWSSDKIMVK